VFPVPVVIHYLHPKKRMVTKPINVALCSFGMSGAVFHAPFINLHQGFKLYAVWERTKNIAEQKYPGIKTYRNYEELLGDKEVELVVVNTPSYSHHEYAKKALLAGKHTIVEKPFTATVAEAEELVGLAQKQNVKLSVFQNRRYDSDYKTVKKIVSENLLGDIMEAEFRYDRYNPNLSPKVHKETAGPGAGCMYDLAPHLIDPALQLFGYPQAVFADIRITRKNSQVDDYFEILLYYPTKRVRLRSGYFFREPVPAFAVHGTKGSFLKSRADVQEVHLQANMVPGTPEWGREPDTARGLLHTEKEERVIREFIPSLQGNYGEYYEGIYNALRNNALLPITGEDGLNVIRIIEASYKSNKEGRVIVL
jgi:scyllo-inositol 2-dehydrogenase (NADP+)